MQKILMLLAIVFIGLNTVAQVQRKVSVTNETKDKAANDLMDATEGPEKIKLKKENLKALNLSKGQKLKL